MGWIFSKPSTLGGNQEDQTRFLFHRCVYDLTCDSDSKLDSGHNGAALGDRASEEMSHMESPCTLFGTDMETLNKVVSCLKKYVQNMKDDTELQEELMKLMRNFSKDTLWEWCQMIFDDVCDGWDAIFTLFALGIQLCFLVAIYLYDIIVKTIGAAVTKRAGGWLLSHGGWVALVAGGGMSKVMMNLLSWMGWLMPSTGSTPKGGASAPKSGASAPKSGASAPKSGASAPKNGIKLD